MGGRNITRSKNVTGSKSITEGKSITGGKHITGSIRITESENITEAQYKYRRIYMKCVIGSKESCDRSKKLEVKCHVPHTHLRSDKHLRQ